MSCQTRKIELIKAKIKLNYEWLDDGTIDTSFSYAMNDYLALRYPIENERPTPDKIIITSFIATWLEIRMRDILSRAGLSLSSYRENNLNLTYGASYIDPNIATMIKPKASVPK